MFIRKRGGILIDEMTIQDDPQIIKKGDSWSIVGAVDMGDMNNKIDIINNERKHMFITFGSHRLCLFSSPIFELDNWDSKRTRKSSGAPFFKIESKIFCISILSSSERFTHSFSDQKKNPSNKLLINKNILNVELKDTNKSLQKKIETKTNNEEHILSQYMYQEVIYKRMNKEQEHEEHQKECVNLSRG
jgi:hypothetical protein